jgi:hypothetical protein
LQGLAQTRVRRLLRLRERRLRRCEDRVQLRAQVLSRDQVLLGFEYQRPVRGLVMGLERGHDRPLYPVPWRRLLPAPEQGPHKGQALAQLSGRRPRRRSDRVISDERLAS